jgi:hypothetical protein
MSALDVRHCNCEDQMLFEYQFDDVSRRIHITARQPFGLGDAVAVLERQATAGAWGYGVLLDLRAGILSPEDQSALLLYIEHLSVRHGRRGPVALISDDLSTAQGYAWRSAHIGQTVKVFRNTFQAERWLNRQAHLRK